MLRIDDDRIKTLKIDAKGEGVVKAGDIISEGGVEVINPEHHIATLSDEAKLYMEMKAKIGRGYVPAENRNRDEEEPIGTTPIDSIFSPVKRVSYNVTPARVGFRTDYDKLTMEIATDGSISALDALSFAAKIIREQMRIFINFEEPLDMEGGELKEGRGRNSTTTFTGTSMSRSLSVRSANCLKNADIKYISARPCKRSSRKILMTKNFGQ